MNYKCQMYECTDCLRSTVGYEPFAEYKDRNQNLRFNLNIVLELIMGNLYLVSLQTACWVT